jgi:release factor glutamine methyltransferase
MNLAAAIDWAADRLTTRQIEDARLEAELLLVHALEIKKSALILNQSLNLDNRGFERFKALIERRLKHEPTAYIIGGQPFLGRALLVNRSVLIPRPETELLAETAIKIITALDHQPVTCADIGTGSGCIAVSLARQCPAALVIGIDTSADALTVAKKNAAAQRVDQRCRFLLGDLLTPLQEPVELIVANPPYIPSAEIDRLQPEVKDWEPRQALDGGRDGLDNIIKLIAQAPNHLKPRGWLLIEIGHDQGARVKKLAAATGKYEQIEIQKDLSGLDRILEARRASG